MKLSFRLLFYVSFLYFLFAGFEGFGQCPTVVSLGSDKVPANFCAPVTTDIEYKVTFLSPPASIAAYFYWGDGSVEVVNLAGGSNSYTVTRTHAYPVEDNCEFIVEMFFRVGGSFCSSTRQVQRIANWRTDEFSGGNIALESPQGGNIFEVCEGDDISVIFDDISEWNCNTDFNPLPNLPETPNEEYRWQQIVYNTVPGGAKIPNVSVDGVLLTDGAGSDILTDYQDPRGVHFLATPVVVGDPDRRNTLEITAPGGFGAGFPVVGDEFEVTIRYWNYCNPYDDDVTDGDFMNPVGGDLINGDNPPVESTAIVRIVDAPPTPTANDNTICNGATLPDFTINLPQPSLQVNWFDDDPGAGGSSITNPNGTNSSSLPASSFPGGIVSTTAGSYTVWATYNSTAGLNCESDAIPIDLTIRESLSQPGSISGSPEVCNGTNNVSFSLPGAAGSTPFGGAVEYEWSSTGGGGVNFDATTGQNITVDFNIVGSFTSVTRTIRVRRIYSTTPECASNYRTFPVTIYGQTLGGTINPDNPICEGGSTGTMTLSGHRGTILRWERADNGGSFNDIGNGGNTTFSEILGSAGIYEYRAVIENGVCATEESSVATITVNPIPAVPSISTSPSATICEDVTTTLTATSNAAAASYQWYKNGAILPGEVNSTITLGDISESGSYTVEAFGINSTNCASGPSAPEVIVVNSLPTATVSGGGSVCSGNPAPDIEWIFTGTAPYDFTITLTPGGTIVETGYTSSTYTIASPTPGGNTDYEMTALTDANGCVSASMGGVASVTMGGTAPAFDTAPTVEPAVCDDGASTDAPDITIDLDAADDYRLIYRINGGSNQTLNFTTDGAGVFVFQPDYTAAPFNTTAGTYSYRFISIENTTTGCLTPLADILDVIINARPGAPANPVDAISCSSGPVNSLSVDDPGAGFTVRWYTSFTNPSTNVSVTGGDGTISGANNEVFTPATSGSATFFAAIETDATGCLSNTAVALTNTEDPAPSANADIDGDLTDNFTCASNFVLGANSPAPGETGTWTGPGGVTFTNINSAMATAQNVPVGTTVLTWTVETALGECPVATDNITIERYSVPDAIDPAPALCELVKGGGTVTGINLNVDYLDAVTGIAGSTDRSVLWFTNLGRTMAVTNPTNYAAVDNGVVYTRVINTITGCTNDGTLTFTIRDLPEAVDLTDEFCEDALNSNKVDGIDLTSYSAAIIGAGSAADRTVDWYTDAARTVAVGTPTNVTVNGPIRTFYARITDTSNPELCTNDAEIDFTILPLPEDNPITGPSTQCVGSSIELYQIDPSITAGSTYTWNIPADFTLFAGGGTNDFFVLLSFPTVTTATLSVTETSPDGCDGNLQTLSIDVVSTPPPLTVSGPATVCENEAGVVYNVASLPSTTYAWTVPTGASIINGQGTNEITVNFGTFGGNVSVIPTSSTGNCAGTTASLPVAVNVRPEIDPNLDNTVCSDDISGIIFTDSGGSSEPALSYDITNISIDPGLVPDGANAAIGTGQSATAILNDIYTNQTGGQLSVRYTVQPRSADDCLGISEIITLRINPEPRLSANLDQEKCSDEASGLNLAVATGSVPATSYNIISVNDGGLIPGAGNAVIPQNGVAANYLSSDAYTNTTTTFVDVEYIIAPVSVNGCIGDPPFTLRFTVNPEPVGSDETKTAVCSDDNFTFNLQPNINANNGLASSFTWTAAYDAGLTGGTGSGTGNISETLINSTGSQLNAVYTVTPTSNINGCQGETFDITVPVDPKPTGNNETKTAVCSDAAFNFDPQTNITNGLTNTFSWVAAYDAGLTGGAASGTGNILETLTNLTGAVLNATYSITPSDNSTGCDGAIFTITVPVNPEPDGSDETKTAVCSNVAFNFNPQANIANGRVSSFSWTASYDVGLSGGAASGSGNLAEILVNTTSGTLNAIYTISPTDNVNGCAGDDFTITVPVNPEPVGSDDVKGAVCSGIAFDFDPQDNVDLNNGLSSNFTWTASYGANITGGAGAGTGHVAEILTNLSGGTENAIYTLTPAVTATGCTGGTFTITVPIEPQPVAVDQAITICSDAAGGNTATVDLTALDNSVNGGTANIVTWYSDALLTVLIASPASHIVTNGVPVYAEIDDGNCQNTAIVTYTINPLPSIVGTVTSNYNGAQISCNGASNGQITVTPGDGSPTYQYSIDGGANYTASNVFNGLGAGSYTVRVRDAKGCEVDSDPIVIDDPDPVTASAAVSSNYNGEDISCNGASDGAITATASGGTGVYTYTLNEIPSNTTGATSGIFTGLAAGTYTIDVRDVNSCFVTTAPVTLDEPADINATAVVSSDFNGSDLSCTGSSDGEITVTAGGGVGTLSYTLIQIPSNTTGASSGVFTGVPAGNYTVRVTDGNSCQEITAPIIISNPPSLSATASVTSNYSGSHISCNGADDAQITVTANGGTGAYTYQLNEIPANTTGATTGVFTNIPPGTYTFNVRDANSCLVTTANVSVFQPVALNANATITSNYNGAAISCNGASDGQITISATGGTGSYNYVLNEIPANTSGATSGIFTGIPAGTYTFNVTDGNTCLFVAGPITINQPNAINATAAVTSNYNGSHVSCNGAANAQITVTATGGTGAFAYTLNENPANTSGSATGVFTGIGAGVYTFSIEDVNNCAFTTASVTVIEPAAILATASESNSINCFGGSTGEITVSASGGTGSYTFDLNEISSNNTGLTTGVYTNIPAGTYTFNVLDVNGCSFTTAPIIIGQPAQVTATAAVTSNYNGAQISCTGADDGIIEITASGGTGAFSYVLNEIAGNTTGASTGIFTGLPPGTYTFNVRDANNCLVTTNPVSISEPAAVSGTLAVTSNYNGEEISCFGASDGRIKATASGGTGAYTYSLVEIPGNTSGATSGIFTGLPAGAYTVEIQDVNNCLFTTSSVTVDEPAAVTATTASDISYNGFDISCNGNSDGRIRVTASNGVSPYSFVLDQIPTNITGASTGLFTGLPAGNYTFTVTDANGCDFTTLLISLSEPNAISGAGSVTSNYNRADISCNLYADGELTVTANGGTGASTYTYLLNEDPSNNTGESSGVFTGVRAGTYTATITDANNCSFITAPVVVTQPDALEVNIAVTSDYNGEHISCNGASDGIIEVTSVTGGTPNFTYELFDQTNTSQGINTTGVFNGLAAGVYKVRATDVNGCSRESFPVVIIPPFPLSAGFISGTQSVCMGEAPSAFTELSAPFGGINSYNYQWEISNDNFVSDINEITGATSSVFGASAMTSEGTFYYRRRVTSGSCTEKYTNVVTVTVNPLPVNATVTGPSDICEGDAFILEFNFPVGQAPFKFDYEDDKGNTYTDVFGASTTPVFKSFGEVTTTTTYTITRVEDLNGCMDFPVGASWTVNVVNIHADFEIVGPADGCSPAMIEFEYDQINGVTYTWQWFDGTPDSTYTATSDVAGMKVRHSFANGSPNNTFNYKVFLRANITVGGTPCAKESSRSVTVYPSVLPNVFTVNSPVCSGDEIKFTNSTAGATEHRWFYREKGKAEQELGVQTVQNASFNITNTGPNNPQVYEVVYTGSKNNSGSVCSATQIVEVEVYKEVIPGFSFSPTSPTFTAGSALVRFTNTSNPVSDDTNFSYNWDFSDGITKTDTPDPGVINYSQPGIKTVVLTIVNKSAPGLCDVKITKQVDIQDVPISIDFDVTPKKGCIPTTVTITNKTTGSANEFTWEVFDQHNQPVYENVQLAEPDQPPLPQIEFELFREGYYSVRLTGRNTFTNQTASVLRDSVIVIFPQPMASFMLRPDVVFLPDQAVKAFNSSIKAEQYFWDFGDGGTSDEFEPEHLYSYEGVFNVTLIAASDHGDGVVCRDTLTQKVVVQEGGATRIPNAFTPSSFGPSSDGRIDGDERNNDIFLPITKGVEEFQMLVFDRWGSLIFESNDQTVGWDGYDSNGRLLPAGVYVYKLTLRLSNGTRTTRIGDITLIR